ncbi:triosephosphate isomerase [Bacteroidia bacterium]|nr:triosephosphate isomerase [Bacteroidia bacterium]
MRKKIVAGNWKMNTTLPEGVALATEIDTKLRNRHEVSNKTVVIIGVPFTHIWEVGRSLAPKFSSVAAQNCAAEASGAYTGEVSAAMIASLGCNYVILGHSERRAYYGETDAILVKKVTRALENKLEVIFCVGEVLAEREANNHFEVVKSQLENGLFNLSKEEIAHIIIAYEPVWAIGTGKTATSAQAQEMHAFIRSTVANKYGKDVADNISILYGGSCNTQNAKELFLNPDVDGGLIGGASLKADDFVTLVDIRENV